jgi:hypothetical protein
MRYFLGDDEDAHETRRVEYERGKPFVEMKSLTERVRRLQEVPPNAESISGPAEAPPGAEVVQGPRGGWYYVPGAGGEATEDESRRSDRMDAIDRQDDLWATIEAQLEDGASHVSVWGAINHADPDPDRISLHQQRKIQGRYEEWLERLVERSSTAEKPLDLGPEQWVNALVKATRDIVRPIDDVNHFLEAVSDELFARGYEAPGEGGRSDEPPLDETPAPEEPEEEQDPLAPPEDADVLIPARVIPDHIPAAEVERVARDLRFDWRWPNFRDSDVKQRVSEALAVAVMGIADRDVQDAVLENIRAVNYMSPMRTVLSGVGGSCSRAAADVPRLGLKENDVLFQLNAMSVSDDQMNVYNHEMAHAVHMVYGFSQDHERAQVDSDVFGPEPSITFLADPEVYHLTLQYPGPRPVPESVMTLMRETNDAFDRVYDVAQEGGPFQEYDMSRAYSTINGAEMLAGAHESLSNLNEDRVRVAVAKIEEHHPNFIDAYADVFGLTPLAEQVLSEYREQYGNETPEGDTA